MSEKLISADKLVRDLKGMLVEYDGITITGLIKSLEEASAVDAVEVVRCCRCRFAVNKHEHGEMVTYCALDWVMRGVLDPNDYCSYGKEKWK